MDLDSLLKSIREENKGGAIVPAKFFGEDRYDKYYDELVNEGRIDGENISPDERKAGARAYRKGKIDFETFVNNVLKTRDEIKKPGQEQYSSNLDLPALPGSKGSAIIKRDSVNIEKFKSEPVSEGTQQNFDDILNGIDSILETLREDNKLKKKESNRGRRKDEERKRKKQEDKLEKNPFKKLGGAVGTILKPIKSLWERVWDFIWNVFLGRTLMKLIDWFSDPENKGKLEAIGKFLEKTWPILLAGYLLFGNSIGRLITSIVANTLKWTVKLGAIVAKQLIPLAKKLGLKKGLMLGGLAVGGAMLVGRMMDGGEDGDAGGVNPTPANSGEQPKGVTKIAGEEYVEGQPMTPKQVQATQLAIDMGNSVTGQRLKDFQAGKDASKVKMEGGGIVPGRGPNRDTVPAMLAPGEFVMSRGAVEKYGTDTLSSMNAAGGGTNLPKMVEGITYAVGGGMIGNKKEMGEKKEELSPQDKKEMEERETKPSEDSKTKPSSGGGLLGGIKRFFGYGDNKDESSNDKKSKEQLNAEKANAELLSFISKGEGGYNSMNQGTSGGSIVGSTHNASSILGKNLTEMTVGEVMEHQGSGKLFAAGRYQIIPSTMKMAVARAGVSPDDQFNQSTQDKLGLALIYNGQRPRLSSYLKKENNDLHGAMEDLAMEWASAPHPDTGRSFYPPANKSSHTVEEVKSALMSAREGGAGKYMSAAPVSSLRSRGSSMSKSRPGGGFTAAGGYGGGRSGGGSSGGGYGGMKSNVVLARKGGVEGKLDKSTGKWTAGDWSKKEKSRYMKFGGNPKKSAPEPPSQSQSSVSKISETQRRRDARRSTSSKKYSGEVNSIGPKHPVPRDSAKSKTLGVLV